MASEYTSLNSYTKNNQNINGEFIVANDNFLNCNTTTSEKVIEATFIPEDPPDNYKKVLGCTNPDASNYNSLSNFDDGSCITFGCINPNATNYNPLANFDNGTCTYLECQDPEARNYNPVAENNLYCIYDPPVFTLQPNDYNVTFSEDYTLNTEVYSTTNVKYSWLKNYQTIPDTNFQDFIFTNFQPTDVGIYSLVAINSGGSVISRDATIGIYYPPPVFITQPSGTALDSGENYTLSGEAEGTTSISYQWYFNGSAIVGATSTSYTINNYNPSLNAGTYVLEALNLGGATLSDAAVVRTKDAPPPPPPPPPPSRCTDFQANNYLAVGECAYTLPNITSQPNCPSEINSSNQYSFLTLTVSFFSKSDTIIKWKQNGQIVGNNISYVIPSGDPLSAEGTYLVELTNKKGTVVSQSCEIVARRGCTDANALNYDSLAVVDNNSCIYPPPPIRYTVSVTGDFDYSCDVDGMVTRSFDCYFSDYPSDDPFHGFKYVTAPILFTEDKTSQTNEKELQSIRPAQSFYIGVTIEVESSYTEPRCGSSYYGDYEYGDAVTNNSSYYIRLNFDSDLLGNVTYHGCWYCGNQNKKVGSITVNGNNQQISYQGNYPQYLQYADISGSMTVTAG